MSEGGVKKAFKTYFDMCRNFDWYFENSDDNRIYTAGMMYREKLREVADSDEVLMKVYKAWEAYKFSGDLFGTLQLPEPQLPDFIPK